MKYFFIFAFMLVLASCTSNPQSTEEESKKGAQIEEQTLPKYKFVKVLTAGGEEVEEFDFDSDSAAIVTLLEKGMKEMFADQGKTFKKAHIINPQGDTLNSEKNMSKMMKYIMKK